jgi:hypothetical protein
MSDTPNDRLLALEGEATLLRHEIASYLSMANQASLSLTLMGKRLGRLEERIDSTRAELVEAAAGDYCDKHEGCMHPPTPTSDGPPILPERLS